MSYPCIYCSLTLCNLCLTTPCSNNNNTEICAFHYHHHSNDPVYNIKINISRILLTYENNINIEFPNLDNKHPLMIFKNCYNSCPGLARKYEIYDYNSNIWQDILMYKYVYVFISPEAATYAININPKLWITPNNEEQNVEFRFCDPAFQIVYPSRRLGATESIYRPNFIQTTICAKHPNDISSLHKRGNNFNSFLSEKNAKISDKSENTNLKNVRSLLSNYVAPTGPVELLLVKFKESNASAFLTNRDYPAFREYLKQHPFDSQKDIISYFRYELLLVLSYVFQLYDTENTFSPPSLPFFQNDFIPVESIYADLSDNQNLYYEDKKVGSKQVFDTIEPLYHAKRWHFSFQITAIFKQLIPLVSSNSAVNMADPLLGLSFSFWLYYVVEIAMLDFCNISKTLDSVTKRGCEILLQLEDVAHSMWNHDGTQPQHIIALKHYTCMLYWFIARMCSRARLDVRAKALRQILVFRSKVETSSESNIKIIPNLAQENSGMERESSLDSWWNQVFCFGEVDMLTANTTPPDYLWLDSNDVLKRVLYLALSAEPSLCLTEGCGSKIQATGYDFSITSIAVMILIQLAFNSIDESLTANYLDFIFKMCKHRDSSFQYNLNENFVPVSRPTPQIQSNVCTSSCCSWWLSTPVLPTLANQLLNPSSKADFIFESDLDPLINFRSYLFHSSTASDIVLLNGSFLKAPKYFQEVPKQVWNLGTPKNNLKDMTVIKCSCTAPTIQEFLNSLPAYQSTRENQDPILWLEAAVKIAKSHHEDIHILLTALWTLALVRMYWLNDINSALIEFQEIEKVAKESLPHFPPISGSLPTRRMCQSMIVRCRSISLQYKQHVAAGRISSKFYPANLLNLVVSGIETDAVYVCFENFSKPLYIANIPGKGECWSTLGRDLSALESWKSILVDNLHIQPGATVQTAICHRILIDDLRSKTYPLEVFIKDIQNRNQNKV